MDVGMTYLRFELTFNRLGFALSHLSRHPRPVFEESDGIGGKFDYVKLRNGTDACRIGNPA
jgi:hypothetical protein